MSVALGCVVLVASPTFSQDNPDTERPTVKRPRSTDNVDYDNQPYYVDGVLYRPYKPDVKKPVVAKPATTVTTIAPSPRAQSVPEAVTATEPEPTQAKKEAETAAITRSEVKKDTQNQSSSESLEVSRPSSTKTPAPLKKRSRYKAAIIQSLDKITAETVRFEVPIGKSIHYRGLIYSIKACEVTSDEETVQDVMAFLQIRTKPVVTNNLKDPPKSKEIFSGWSFGRAPGLNPVQHPIYDAWVIGCRKPQT